MIDFVFLKINFKNILIKFIFLSFFKCLLYSIKSLLKTDFGLLKFRHEERKTDYQDKYNHLKYKYQSYSFLNSFLKEINLISHDYTSKLKSDNKKVHIISNLDNKYFYPSIVSINSVLRNSNKNKTTIVYHILFHEDLSRKKINKLKSLLLLYPTNLEMIFYNMGNLFSEYKGRRFNNVAFYRLLAPIFIPVEKIIYLDSDVLVFKDLEEMYNLDLKNNYILGFLDILSNGVDYLGLKSEKYINSGVLLINLDLIRKHQKYYEILYMYKNNKKLENNDQTIINYVFYPNIGILPSKFGIFNFDSIIDIKYLYLKSIRQKINFSELIEAFKHPFLMHYVLCNPKVWNSNTLFTRKQSRNGTIYKASCKKYNSIWMEYARNTTFFSEIIKYYRLKR